MVESWMFLTNHARGLLALAFDPDLSLRDLATTIGVTERTAHTIVEDLCHSGHLMKRRVGRRNTYTIKADARVPGTTSGWPTIGELVSLIG